MIILGIETSCDETAVAIVEANGELGSLDFKVLGSAINSQVALHAPYGGVYPNLAKREHQKNLPLVMEEAFKKAGLDHSKIDLITVTVGPGLEPALWVGITWGEKLGKSWGIPVIPANHMEGHIASVLFNKTDANPKPEILNPKSFEFRASNFEFPAIALLVSGGHTELVYLKSWLEKAKIGETKDDAVGEAFDKVARMLGLPYPGGPEISRLAEEARAQNIILDTKLPRPMIHSKDFDFSFSGLKTAVLYHLRKTSPPSDSKTNIDIGSAPLSLPRRGGLGGEVFVSQEEKLAIAREFEDAVIETLVTKTKKAIEEYRPKTLIIGGGVIGNAALRKNFLNLRQDYRELEVLIPEKPLTTDNAVMIAAAGFIEYLRDGDYKGELRANGKLDID